MALPNSQMITCMRNDALQILVRVNGVDLTNAFVRFAVSINQDPIGRQFVLLPTGDKGAEGVRLVRTGLDADQLPFSILEIIAAKEKLIALPAAAEFGGDAPFYCELQTNRLNIPDDVSDQETTLMRGPFIVKGSIND